MSNVIYVTGDMHGDPQRFSERALRRLRAEDTLLILGDFGFVWQGGEEEERALDMIGARRYQVLFLPGAHENYSLLEQYPIVSFAGGQARQLRQRLYMLLPGEIYELEGQKIFALGGGQSEDVELRQEGKSWWPQELPSAQTLEAAAKNLAEKGPADFILTHEAPQKLRTAILMREEEPNRLGVFLDRVMEREPYQKWYFGCYHIDRKVTRKHFAVYRQVLRLQEPERRGVFARLFHRRRG